MEDSSCLFIQKAEEARCILEKILFLLLRSDDPEVEKAFGIMQEYGHASNFANYEFPAHNTQLEVLLWLAEEREIRNYERITLAN